MKKIFTTIAFMLSFAVSNASDPISPAAPEVADSCAVVSQPKETHIGKENAAAKKKTEKSIKDILLTLLLKFE